MNQDWSKEPWEIYIPERDHPHYGNHLIRDGNRENICFSAWTVCPHRFRKDADAERIVACVNACRGIPTDLLEIIIANGLLDTLEYVHDIEDIDSDSRIALEKALWTRSHANYKALKAQEKKE